MIGAKSEELAKEAFSRMNVHLDLNMTMIRPLDGLQQVEYLKQFGGIYKRLEKRLEPVLVNHLALANCNPFFNPSTEILSLKKIGFFTVLNVLFSTPSKENSFSSSVPIF